MPDPITTPGTPPVIGVIGGSGVYDIDGLENTHWEKVSSPFGDPSDELMMGELGGQKMVFLPRHGRQRYHAPACRQANFRCRELARSRPSPAQLAGDAVVGVQTRDSTFGPEH